MPLSAEAVRQYILLGDHGPLVAQGSRRAAVPYGHLGAVPCVRHLIITISRVEKLGRTKITHVSASAPIHVPMVLAMPLIVVLIMTTSSSTSSSWM
jgi:hypothetical protein